jgi:hypothetical protein
LVVATRIALTIAEIVVRDGEAIVQRGGLAPKVLADLRDVLAHPAVHKGTIRVYRDGGHARVQLRGEFSEAQSQRIRNVIGSVPLAKLLNTRRRV